MEKGTKEVIALLLPKIQETVKAVVDGNLESKLPSLKEAMSNDLWDKAVAEIGRVMKLPPELINKLQTLDDLVRQNELNVSSKLGEMITMVEAFKDRLKGIDLNQTITMSYGDLQKVRTRSAMAWSAISFALGFFSGIVTLLRVLNVI